MYTQRARLLHGRVGLQISVVVCAALAPACHGRVGLQDTSAFKMLAPICATAVVVRKLRESICELAACYARCPSARSIQSRAWAMQGGCGH